MTKTYDPAVVFVKFKGMTLTGFMDGTFVTVERKEETWMPFVGVNGETARARNRNKSGTVKVTLMQTSSSNDFLSRQMIDDEATGLGTGPLLVKDGLGSTIAGCDDAYLLKPANIEYGKEIVAREWTFECPALDMFVGGIPTT